MRSRERPFDRLFVDEMPEIRQYKLPFVRRDKAIHAKAYACAVGAALEFIVTGT
ncbi:MAG: hypothetical protein ABUL48_00705 [Pseudorhodoplanes sp.]